VMWSHARCRSAYTWWGRMGVNWTVSRLRTSQVMMTVADCSPTACFRVRQQSLEHCCILMQAKRATNTSLQSTYGTPAPVILFTEVLMHVVHISEIQ
jgi:hypothetical protein